jgi:hypothetical protein
VLLASIILKGLLEVALVLMLGQGILFVLAGSSRHQNLVYRIFAVATKPIMKATRFITPRFIVDAHIGFVAFFLLVVLWVLAVALKVHFFIEAGGTRAPPASTAPAK